MKIFFYSLIFFTFIISCTPKKQPKVTTSFVSNPEKNLFQAISYVDENTVWVSGHKGTFMRSRDGGKTWKIFKHPTGDTLQFRDLYALNSDKVILMTAGEGNQSRIFSFEKDSIWNERFVMQDSLGFLDAIAFWDNQKGLAFGDAIDDYPYILLTTDGGKTWNRADSTYLPKAGKGEGGFAASGTCVIAKEDGKAWIATGSSGNCRILFTSDFGKTWELFDSPLVKGDAAGNTSISMIGKKGFLVGGDLMKSKAYTNNVAFSEDGGKSWKLASQPVTKGAFYCGDLVKMDEKHYYAFASGPNGIDYSTDLGKTWIQLDTLNYWAIQFNGNKGIAVGKDGVLQIEINE